MVALSFCFRISDNWNMKSTLYIFILSLFLATPGIARAEDQIFLYAGYYGMSKDDFFKSGRPSAIHTRMARRSATAKGSFLAVFNGRSFLSLRIIN